MRSTKKQLFDRIASGVVLIAIVLVLIQILFPNFTTRDAARAELLAFRSKLAIGMDHDDIEAAFAEVKYRYLDIGKASDALWIIYTPFLVGAKNWEIRLNFQNGLLIGYLVRTQDNDKYLPGGAPADVGMFFSGDDSRLTIDWFVDGIMLETRRHFGALDPRLHGDDKWWGGDGQ